MKGSLLLILLTLQCMVFAQEKPINYSNKEEVLQIGGNTLIYEALPGDTNPYVAIKSKKFTTPTQKVPNLGITKSTIWVKFTINNLTDESALLLEFAQPDIDEVKLFKLNHNNQLKLIGKSGENYPFSDRAFEHQNHLFKLDFNKEKETVHTYYMMIQSSEQIMLSLNLGSKKSIFEESHTKDIIFGLYIGIMLAMALYNLFIFFTIKDKTYLLYVAHTILVTLAQASILGYPNQYLWPESIWLAQKSVIIFSCLVGVVAIEFIRNFLKTQTYLPRFYKYSYIISGIYIITLLLCLFNQYHLSYTLIQMNGAHISLFVLISAIIVYKRGYQPAKFFLLAWSTLMIGIFVFVMKDFGILPNNTFTTYTMPTGSALETLFLSFALADRIKILRKEKEASQKRELEVLQENERIIREQNITLEKEVAARTADLKEANSELENTLDELKNTQAQLVDSEKMASLGQLTAGIAHEINNPINFVVSNVSPLKRDLQDLFDVMNKYREVEDDTKKIEEAIKLRKDLDADFLKEEIEMLLNGIEEGAKRTAEIVKGLKIFARLDEGGVKSININEGIESTLMLIGNDLDKRGIRVEKQLKCDKKVECDSGKMNQVFMNVLTNAMQALGSDHDREKNKTIFIETRIDNSDVSIIFRDNGPGIDDKYKNKVFDPFFTTKDVGEGTGLGLSIALNIIKSHNGTIELNSEKGKGTEFVIKIPQKQV